MCSESIDIILELKGILQVADDESFAFYTGWTAECELLTAVSL